MIHVFDNVLSESKVDYFYNTIKNHFLDRLEEGYNSADWYPTRNISLDNDNPVIEEIKDFIESKLRVKLTPDSAELQTWPIGSDSDLHIHDAVGRMHGDYNSLLYLNDDFDDGEFYTENGIIIKPMKNRLTFFNGRYTYHGVKKVARNHRHTIIFWWKNTQFY